MKHRNRRCLLYLALSFGLTLGILCWVGGAAAQSKSGSVAAVTTLPGMPPVLDPTNLYSEASAGRLSPAVVGALQRVYVPNVRSNDVYVIDPATLKIVDHFKVGVNPQHVVPSWDLKTLWVANNAEGLTDGSLTPIDPKTGKPLDATKPAGQWNHVRLLITLERAQQAPIFGELPRLVIADVEPLDRLERAVAPITLFRVVLLELALVARAEPKPHAEERCLAHQLAITEESLAGRYRAARDEARRSTTVSRRSPSR